MTHITTAATRARDARHHLTHALALTHHPDLTAAITATTGSIGALALTDTWQAATACTLTAAALITDHHRIETQARTAIAWLAIAQEWAPACAANGLTRRRWGVDHHPLVVRITSPEPGQTVLHIKPHPHHRPADYEDPELRRALGAHHATATWGKRGRILLTLHDTRPRTRRAPAHQLTTTLHDLTALPVARDTSTGKPVTLPLLYTHVLLAGATRAGKSGGIWAFIDATLPHIQAGTVRWRVIDPKGGMELGPGAHLFHTFVHSGAPSFGADAVQLVEDTAREVVRRADQLRGTGQRKLAAVTPAMPHEVLLVDEMLALKKLLTKEQAARFDAALVTILAMGAAAGVTVVYATQDPRKESGVGEVRDLTPLRICLRVNEPAQVDLILGRGAREAGAAADAIEYLTEAGTAYVARDGAPGYQRVRFVNVTDELIGRMSRYAPQRAVQLQEAAPDAAPLRDVLDAPATDPGPGEVPVLDAWAGGAKRSRDDAARLLDLLADAGEPVPTGRELGEWAGRTDRWGRDVIATWRDEPGKRKAAGSGDRPLAAESTVPARVPQPVPSPTVPETAQATTSPALPDTTPSHALAGTAPHNGDQL